MRLAACAALLLILAGGGTLRADDQSRGLGGETVKVWLTTPDLSQALTRQPALAFTPDRGDLPVTIKVNDQIRYQRMDGFGAALTDTSAWLIAERLNAATRAVLMRALFSPTQGIGVDWVRIPMGSSDFTHDQYYSYDDNDGVADPLLTQFSIAHDLAYIIPELREA
ncbi:MAG: glycosyl hydrolase, partial [Chloroflexota bacterium]